MASFMTNLGKSELLKRNLTTGQVWRLLLVNTPPANSHAAAILTTVSTVTSNELTVGNGYARQSIGGPNVTFTTDNTGDRVIISASNPTTYTAIADGTIAGAWFYLRVSGGGADTDASDVLVAFLDCTDLVTNGGDVTLSFDATNGIITLS